MAHRLLAELLMGVLEIVAAPELCLDIGPLSVPRGRTATGSACRADK